MFLYGLNINIYLIENYSCENYKKLMNRESLWIKKFDGIKKNRLNLIGERRFFFSVHVQNQKNTL